MKKLFALILGLQTSCSFYFEDEYSFEKLPLDEIVEDISYSKPDMIANGSDTAIVYVVVNEDADDSLAKVKLETTKGTFVANGTKKIEGNPKVGILDGKKQRFFSTILKSDLKAGTATVVAEVSTIREVSAIEFRKNLPTEIEVIPSTLGISPSFNSEISVTVLLKSDKGAVSSNHPFELEALDEQGYAIGTFRVKVTQCDSSECISQYTVAPDTAHTGIIELKASTIGINGQISNSVNIYSIK